MNSLVRFIVNKSKLFRFIPDKIYLKIIYRAYMNKKLDLKNPKTFNEKIQWLKIYNRRKEFTELVDKYNAKFRVDDLLGSGYTIRTLGVWDRFEDIDFDKLPNQFVLKCTHDSGGGAICRDKNSFDIKGARYKIEKSLKNQFFYKFREWVYKDVKPRIIAEEYMTDGRSNSLTDYKFFCFNGKPKMLYVSDGMENHSTARLSFFDLEGNLLPFYRKDYTPFSENIVLPDSFPDMLKIAEKLASSIKTPFVRIDLYEICGKVYFSEITFYPNAGLIPFEPDEYDRRLGDLLNLDLIK